MLQNKIYQNYIFEILKTFFTILFGLSAIAWTVRAVNFLDLIVDNGYPVLTYFFYSFKFIWNNDQIFPFSIFTFFNNFYIKTNPG